MYMNQNNFITFNAVLTIVRDTVGVNEADVEEKHFSVLILVL